MKKYTYYFNDGTKSIVEVPNELYDILIAFDDEELNNNRRNTRRHSSLEGLAENGIEIADKNSDACEQCKNKELTDKIDAIIASLTPSQRELFEAIFYDKQKVIDIAEKQGVSQQAITDRLTRIQKKFVKLL